MKLPKTRSNNLAKLDIEIEKELVDALNVMERHTKISKVELLETALKRFITGHKDYFPDDYKQ